MPSSKDDSAVVIVNKSSRSAASHSSYFYFFRNLALSLNILLVFVSSIAFVGCILVYCHPIGWNFITALSDLIAGHGIIIGGLLFNTISICLGVLGARAIRKQDDVKIGAQIFAFIFVVTLEVALLFALVAEWMENLHEGVTFAVQSFNPAHPKTTIMAGIQYALRCCGRGSYKDYSIANEAFLSEYVPISCCDLTKYTWYHCLNASSTQRRLDCNLKISFDQQKQLADIYFSYAYTTGCADRLQNFIFPLLIILFTTNAGLEMICMFALSCYLKFSTDLALDDTDDIGSDKIAAAQDNGEATSQKKLDATPKNRIVRLKQPVVNETTPWIDENEEEEEEEATNEA